ncbi:hypothetical protein [Micromonospora sp. WMMD998]|uniref:hypothetical protein n=1 Tax=Micromonospora sp. WMMD998 TaxID=3016092 RepID=UPI00249B36FD|nr:hypothetical protein [Micromonospora sp. WMMD998]WFE39658.1 hypothetical protein O7619_14950 [Micromonospora sp. WMMD998]
MTTVATIIGVLFAGAALLRDYFNWEHTDPEAGRTPTGVTGAPSPDASGDPTTGPATAASPTSGPAGVHLDSLPVESGAGNIVALPRALKGTAGLDRAVAVRCPENSSGDKQREVTYDLRRRYLDLTLTVRAHSPGDPQAPVRVTAYAAVRRPDDSGVDRLRRALVDAREGAPGKLAADVAGADGVILSVECQFPDSVVILADTRVTPA